MPSPRGFVAFPRFLAAPARCLSVFSAASAPAGHKKRAAPVSRPYHNRWYPRWEHNTFQQTSATIAFAACLTLAKV